MASAAQTDKCYLTCVKSSKATWKGFGIPALPWRPLEYILQQNEPSLTPMAPQVLKACLRAYRATPKNMLRILHLDDLLEPLTSRL